MNILFLSHYYFPEGNAAATRVSALASRWVKMGHKVTVVTCAPNVPNGKVYSGYKNKYTLEDVEGVKVIRIKTFIAANKGAFKRILNFLSYMFSAFFTCLFMKKPDIMIATSPQFFCGFCGTLLKWFRGFPFVLEIRDIWPESISAVGAKVPGIGLKFISVLEKLMYKSALHIVTVGEGYKQKLTKERGVPENKISIIMNGVDSTLYYPGPKDKELLKQYNLEGKFICSYIGTIGMACGLKVVLEAAKILKTKGKNDIVFLLIGGGATKEDLENQAKAEHLDNILFLGLQPKNKIASWVNTSDVTMAHLIKTDLFKTVMPSKIFESAGCAKPILLGVQGFAEKFVKDNSCGLCFEPENAQDLVEKLLQLYENKDLCKTLGENGLKNIATKYNRDSQAKKYIEILNDYVK